MEGKICNIIVITKDFSFQRLMQSALSCISSRELIFFFRSVPEAQTKFSKSVPGVILYDLDVGHPLENLFTQLVAVYKLLIVLTGSRLTVPPEMFGARHTAYIPKTQIIASETSFLNSLRVKINAFLLTNPANSFQKSQQADQSRKIIAIASSTGGTDALQKIFLKLDTNAPPVVVVQHMPSGFTKLFAERLNSICAIGIKEADDSDYLSTGLVLIAPAGRHMTITLRGGKLITNCYEGQKLNGVIPAADILFDSVAAVMKQNAVGVILTGMGADGARGLMKMHGMGAKTIGQDQETCVVYGMPKAAFDLGAVDYQLPLDGIADKMIALAR